MSQFPEVTNDDSSASGPLLVRSITHQLNSQDLDSIISMQRDSLARFEKTNEMLSNCNTLSVSRLAAAMKEIQPYRQTLTEMKRDLDAIFRRIRVYKQNFSQSYPEAFAATSDLPTPSNEHKEEPTHEENSKDAGQSSTAADESQ